MRPADINAIQTENAALRERVAGLSRVQRIGLVGGFEIDLRGGLFLNHRSPEYLGVHGLPADAAREAHDAWVQRLHPDDRERAETHFKNCVEGDARTYSSEYRVNTAGEGVRWIAAIAEIDRDEAGAPLRMVGIHIDITRTKEAEIRLREVMESIGEAFYALDSKERVTNVNRRALEMWGRSVDQVIGRHPGEFLPESAISGEAHRAVMESMRSGQYSRTEALASSLGDRWIEQDAYPTAEGGVAVAVRDIHERKQIEIALKESERRLRDLNEGLERLANERARQLASSRAQLQAFFDNSPDWLTLQRCTPDGQFIYVDLNPTCEAAYGLVRANVVGRTVEEVLGREAAQLPIAHFRECLRTGQPQRYVTHRTMAGVTRFIDVISALVPGEYDHGDRFLLTSARDLTDREELEIKLRQAQKMEAIGQLTGGVARDFNNLLTIIVGSATLIERGATKDPAKLIHNILVAGARGAALTRQLLSLSRHRPQSRELVELTSEMPRIGEMLRSSLRGDIELQINVEPNVLPIEVDLGELEIALLNVAVNARDAMPNGGEFTIDVRNQGPQGADREYVAITLQDNGFGMPAEVIARASEPFFTTKELGSGTGLGLNQVYNFAQSAGGVVQLESEVGRGTRLTIYLPQADGAKRVASDERRDARSRPLNGRVLLVDDNVDVMNVTQTMMSAMGLGVETASRASEALERILSQPDRFNLLLTDVVMPGMNGMDLAQEVRITLPNFPVLLMSGYNDSANATEYRVLRKPIPYDELYDAIRAHLADAHEERQNPEADIR